MDAQRQSETPDQAGPVHIELEGEMVPISPRSGSRSGKSMLVIAASVAVAVSLVTATVIALVSFGPGWWDTNKNPSSETVNNPSFRRSKYAHAQVRSEQDTRAIQRASNLSRP